MEIQLFTATAADFPSRYPLGAHVYFHPGIQGMTDAEGITHGLLARIARVSFAEGKVTYDLAMNISNSTDLPHFYDAILVASVDSIFVASFDDLVMWTAQRAKSVETLIGAIDEPQLVTMATASGALTLPDAERITRRFITIAADVAEQKEGR